MSQLTKHFFSGGLPGRIASSLTSPGLPGDPQLLLLFELSVRVIETISSFTGDFLPSQVRLHVPYIYLGLHCLT